MVNFVRYDDTVQALGISQWPELWTFIADYLDVLKTYAVTKLVAVVDSRVSIRINRLIWQLQLAFVCLKISF